MKDFRFDGPLSTTRLSLFEVSVDMIEMSAFPATGRLFFRLSYAVSTGGVGASTNGTHTALAGVCVYRLLSNHKVQS